ncbi:hypothetical protein F4678DRAFT_92057 [Xylaria arbuscula]|nr:hypothetical protein F4678DRAFT_92057 [Xylaria arbuscula]
MADKLKPDMLDSVDAGLSKPTPVVLAHAYCATVISNLEGWRGFKLSSAKEISEVTISQVDTRIRRLEMTANINPPPPVDIPSWDSLMWRVARLHRMMPAGATTIRFGAAPPLITPSLDLLRTTMASIGGVGLQSWAVFTEGDDLEKGDRIISAAAQYLCNLAGKRGFKIIGSFELALNCSLALELSLDKDANPRLYIGPRTHPMPGQGLVGSPARSPLKTCCGCCSCSCHTGPGLFPRVVNVTKPKRAKQRNVKARIANVFRKLAFWRRCRSADDSDSDSDASSTTTGSSSTLN